MGTLTTGLPSDPDFVTLTPRLDKPLGATVITSLATAKGLAEGSPAGIPAGARLAQVTPENGAAGAVRYQRKGTPTSTAGTVMPSGTSCFEGSLTTLKFIDSAGGTSVLQVEFFA